MEAFNLNPPSWTSTAVHAPTFRCPQCRATPLDAQSVWINRAAPVITQDRQRRWQEFYHCQCNQSWWAWSSERPPTELSQRYSQS